MPSKLRIAQDKKVMADIRVIAVATVYVDAVRGGHPGFRAHAENMLIEAVDECKQCMSDLCSALDEQDAKKAKTK